MASFVGAAAAAAATTGCGGLLYGLSTVGMAADDVNATNDRRHYSHCRMEFNFIDLDKAKRD